MRATLPVLLKVLQPSAGEATLRVYCCPKRVLMEEPKEACITCKHGIEEGITHNCDSIIQLCN